MFLGDSNYAGFWELPKTAGFWPYERIIRKLFQDGDRVDGSCFNFFQKQTGNTAKLRNNHSGLQSKDFLKGILLPMIGGTSHLRLVGRAETGKGLPTPMGSSGSSEGRVSAGGSLRGVKPEPQAGSQPSEPELGRGVHIASSCEKWQGSCPLRRGRTCWKQRFPL